MFVLLISILASLIKGPGPRCKKRKKNKLKLFHTHTYTEAKKKKTTNHTQTKNQHIPPQTHDTQPVKASKLLSITKAAAVTTELTEKGSVFLPFSVPEYLNNKQ